MEISEFPNIRFEHPRGSAFRKYRSQTLAPVQFTNPNSNHRAEHEACLIQGVHVTIIRQWNRKGKEKKNASKNTYLGNDEFILTNFAPMSTETRLKVNLVQDREPILFWHL